jgi:AraC family transcriptional regulator
VTPYRFLVQARIRRALALLRNTSRPVTEIAFDTGFGDLSNFINAFRREIGCSPRQYRQSGPPRLE